MDLMGLKGSLHVVFSPSNVRILATGKYFNTLDCATIE